MKASVSGSTEVTAGRTDLSYVSGTEFKSCFWETVIFVRTNILKSDHINKLFIPTRIYGKTSSSSLSARVALVSPFRSRTSSNLTIFFLVFLDYVFLSVNNMKVVWEVFLLASSEIVTANFVFISCISLFNFLIPSSGLISSFLSFPLRA